MKEMERVKSLWTGKEYTISRIANSMAVLSAADGQSQVLTDLDNLGIFYKKIEHYSDGS